MSKYSLNRLIIVIAIVIIAIVTGSKQAMAQAPVFNYGSTGQIFIVGSAITTLNPISSTNVGQTSVLVGNASGIQGNLDGTGTSAYINGPLGAVVDANGNIYIAEQGYTNGVIRKITPQGVATTFTTSGVWHPSDLAIDAAGNLYICNEDANKITKITPSGTQSTVAGSGGQGNANGAPGSATFYNPCGVAITSAGIIYVADTRNNLIRKFDPSTNTVTTLAGSGAALSVDGTGIGASFGSPFNLITDAVGNIYVTDRSGNKVRKVTPAGVVTTLAGSGVATCLDGTGLAAAFKAPTGITIDASGNLYVADGGGERIRKITPLGVVTTIAGTGGTGLTNGPGYLANFNNPFGMAIDKVNGFLYVCDHDNNQIRKILNNPSSYSISPALPAGLTMDPNSGAISGTPAVALSKTIFTVTGTNSTGTGTAQLSITVVTLPAPLFGNQNYVATYTPSVSFTTADGMYAGSSDKANVQVNVQFLDGLGRAQQTVQVKGSPLGNDLVQSFTYDLTELETHKYLPYTASGATDGSFKSNALIAGAGVDNFYNPAGTPVSQTQLNNGIPHIATPFALTMFEPSPLARVTEQGAPGNTWQPNTSNPDLSHTVRIAYTTNDNTDITSITSTFKVMSYGATIASDGTYSIINALTNAYTPGQLYVTITKDENWQASNLRAGTIQEFMDKDNRLILKRIFNKKPDNTVEMLSTYYVYDDYGNLAFVLPPGANPDNGSVDQPTLDNFCYQYRYDRRNRLSEKKLPGQGWIFYVYNLLNQVVLSQDANQRSKGPQQWTFSKYDAFGRIIMTGLQTAGTADANLSAPSRTGLQAFQNLFYNPSNAIYENRDNTTTTGYDGLSDPTGNTYSYLNINYYDDYAFPGNPYTTTAVATIANPNGLLTGTKNAILNPDGTVGPMLWVVNYYDSKERIAQKLQQHYLGANYVASNYDEINNFYDFNNRVSYVIHHHYISDVQDFQTEIIYKYDHMGRKIQTAQSIASGTTALPTPTVLSSIQYNEAGQLYKKSLNSANSSGSALPTDVVLGTADALTTGQKTTQATNSISMNPGFSVSAGATFVANIVPFLQTITYTYNERGWMRTATTNGNLLNIDLKYDQPDAGSTPQYNGNIAEMNYLTTKVTNPGNRSFSYSYDNFNRLTNATFTGGLAADALNESVTYDVMGNIKQLIRGGPLGGTLNYDVYTGNQLTTVSGYSPRNYLYDNNGNATSDGTGKSINYNMINLPRSVSQSNNNSVTLATYTYNEAGLKLRNTGSDGAWDYDNGFVYYTPIGGAIALAYLQTDEGRITYNNGVFKYEYSLKDHLGNNRVNIDQYNNAARVIQEDEYYPFGFRKPTGGYDFSSRNRLLYNGKEVQTDLAKQYDYGARFYDPVIARWTTMDALAGKYHSLSPYNYVSNSPIKITDLDGNDWFRDVTGNVIWNDSRAQTLTQNNITYTNIGNTLTIITRSYINVPNDLPLPEGLSGKAAGIKLVTTLTLTGNYADGKFAGFTYDYQINKIGATFDIKQLQGVPYPGKNNTATGAGNWDGILNTSAHFTTHPIETIGLQLIGRNVDVNQELSVSLDKNSKLNINIEHGVYPSVRMNVGGDEWYNFQQQSFILTHATRFWSETVPLWAQFPDFFIRMYERENQAIKDSKSMNKEYQNNNKVGSVTLNDKN